MTLYFVTIFVDIFLGITFVKLMNRSNEKSRAYDNSILFVLSTVDKGAVMLFMLVSLLPLINIALGGAFLLLVIISLLSIYEQWFKTPFLDDNKNNRRKL